MNSESNIREFFEDYESGKRLLSPFVLITLPGSNKPGVPLNTTSLDERCMIIDNLLLPQSPEFFQEAINSERLFYLFDVSADYDLSNLPNLLKEPPNIQHRELIGYFSEESVKDYLPKVYRYFDDVSIKQYSWELGQVSENKPPKKIPVEETLPEDDIPF